jgi:uroporphyrinogen-III synthase
LIPVIVIRPQPGCDTTVAAVRALGLDGHGFPLFKIRAVGWEPPPPEGFDALLLGSANAIRHAGPALGAYSGKPAYAVGAVTAAAARAARLDVVATGEGGIDALLPMLRFGHRRLLRLSGRERMVIAPPPGVAIDNRVVYASAPLPLPPKLVAMLARPAVILLHSAQAARRFAELCDTARLDRAQLLLAALGPRIAGAAGTGWRAVETAVTPSDTALLALAGEMCQDPGGVKGKSRA